MIGPLVTIRFYVRSPDRVWDLRRETALRHWHHVPRAGDRIDLDEMPTPDVPDDVQIGIEHGRVDGLVEEVIWAESHVKVLLKW